LQPLGSAFPADTGASGTPSLNYNPFLWVLLIYLTRRRKWMKQSRLQPCWGPIHKALVYQLLGFNPMTDEDSLRMWARLKNTQTGWPAPCLPIAGMARP